MHPNVLRKMKGADGPRKWVYENDEKETARLKVDGSPVRLAGDRFIDGPGVYLVIASNGFCKIGCTSKIYKRISQLWTVIPTEFEVYAFLPTESYRFFESSIHEIFQHRRIKGEWFALSEKDLEDLMERYEFVRVGKDATEFLTVY